MKFDKDKIFKALQDREEKQGRWETVVRWVIATWAAITGIIYQEWSWAIAIIVVFWFLPVIVIPWISGKLYGAQWYINLQSRNRTRMENYPKDIRWPIQALAVLFVFWLMNGFKFWPITG